MSFFEHFPSVYKQELHTHTQTHRYTNIYKWERESMNIYKNIYALIQAAHIAVYKIQ